MLWRERVHCMKAFDALAILENIKLLSNSTKIFTNNMLFSCSDIHWNVIFIMKWIQFEEFEYKYGINDQLWNVFSDSIQRNWNYSGCVIGENLFEHAYKLNAFITIDTSITMTHWCCIPWIVRMLFKLWINVVICCCIHGKDIRTRIYAKSAMNFHILK